MSEWFLLIVVIALRINFILATNEKASEDKRAFTQWVQEFNVVYDDNDKETVKISKTSK